MLTMSVALSAAACSADEGDDKGAAHRAAGGEANASDSLCSKYGGAEQVASVVQTQVLGAIAADCRINTFFTTLGDDSFTRVKDCLTIQVQELFGCEGISYAGARASTGFECRSMADSHAGLGISEGDFVALIEDVVAGLQEAGVEQADIDAAAPALLGMQEDIVERAGDEPTRAMCTDERGDR